MASFISSLSFTIPPVSTNKVFLLLKSIKPWFLSFVRPGKSETIASLDLVNLLNKVDLPTFGRPIIAIEVNISKFHLIC